MARRSPMRRMIPTSASALPKRASMPSVSSRLTRPRSASSITSATAFPADIVSMPSSSHSSFALTMAPKSEIPQLGPRRAMLSNSVRARAPAYAPSLTS